MQVIGWGRIGWRIGAVAWLGCASVMAAEGQRTVPTGDIPQSAWPAAWFPGTGYGFGGGIADLPPVARAR